MQTNRKINITGLQTSDYDIFVKLSQLDVRKPTRLPPYYLLIRKRAGKWRSLLLFDLEL